MLTYPICLILWSGRNGPKFLPVYNGVVLIREEFKTCMIDTRSYLDIRICICIWGGKSLYTVGLAHSGLCKFRTPLPVNWLAHCTT